MGAVESCRWIVVVMSQKRDPSTSSGQAGHPNFWEGSENKVMGDAYLLEVGGSIKVKRIH
jgi:hypothetical protein